MKPSIFSRFSLAVGLVTLAVTSLRADFIQPVAVQASLDGVSGLPFTATNLINGIGWLNDTNPPVGSTNSVTDQNLSHWYYSVGSPPVSWIFDLGQTVNLTQVYVWNAENGTSFYDGAGFSNVEVYVSSESNIYTATNFDGIAQITLVEGGTNCQIFNAVGTSVRLVKLVGLNNFNTQYLMALAAVRFGSGTVSGNMPWVVLNSPLDGAEIGYPTNLPGADVPMNVTVTDPDGPSDIQMVQYFDGATLLTNRAAPPYNVVLHGITSGSHTLRAMATDQSGKVAFQEAHVFVRAMYADSVIKIDDTADIGTNVNQIIYYKDGCDFPSDSGCLWNTAVNPPSDPRYMHNDHYDSTGDTNNYYQVFFRGVKIDVYSTVANYHGDGFASIDGGPETRVTFYAPQRAAQQFIYGSPVLSNGVHALKMRCANPSTTNDTVTADRFDVQVYNLAATNINLVAGNLTINVKTPNPQGQHQLWTSTDLINWSMVPAAVVTPTSDHTISISLTGVAGNQAFYRVVYQNYDASGHFP